MEDRSSHVFPNVSPPADPPPTHEPLIAKHPPRRLSPLAKVEVPLGLILIALEPDWRDSRVPGVDVPIPTNPKGEAAVEIVKTGVLDVDVAILHALGTPFAIVVVAEAKCAMLPPRITVLDAFSLPDTVRTPPTEDDALETKPPNNVERLAT